MSFFNGLLNVGSIPCVPLPQACVARCLEVAKRHFSRLDGRFFRGNRTRWFCVNRLYDENTVMIMPSRNASCPCGSGKKYKRCCGSGASVVDTQDSAQLALKGAAYLQRGENRLARGCFETILERFPGNTQARYLLGLCIADSEPERALGLIGEALDAGLQDPAAYFHYGRLLLEKGDRRLAVSALKTALALRPRFVQAARLLGNLYHEGGDFTQAAACYRQALRDDADDFQSLHNLGKTLYRLREFEAAIDMFRRAADVAPEHPDVLVSLAALLEQEHAVDEAGSVAGRVLALDDRHPAALTLLARMALRNDDSGRAVKYLEQACLEGYPLAEQAAWHQAHAELLDKQGSHVQAMAALRRAKALSAKERLDSYDETRWRRYTDDQRGLLRLCAGCSSREPADILVRPLFITGFFRSGTTLLEQMLAAHSRVESGGELTWLPDAEIHEAGGHAAVDRAAPWAEAPADDVMKRLQRIGARYRASMLKKTDTNPPTWFVDKLPFNLMRYAVIRQALPEARVIRMMRHPLDIVLSNFFHIYMDMPDWSYRQRDIADLLIKANALADDTENAACVIRVRYEDLAREPEAVLDRLGLEWDAGLLDFHRSGRKARTASYEQVTRPVYTDSIYRYKRYLSLLDDALIDKLRPLIEAEGYTV